MDLLARYGNDQYSDIILRYVTKAEGERPNKRACTPGSSDDTGMTTLKMVSAHRVVLAQSEYLDTKVWCI